MKAEEMLFQLMKNHFTYYKGSGYEWDYIEETSLGELDEVLARDIYKFMKEQGYEFD